MDTRGVKVVEVQQTVAELRKTQSSVRRSLGETRDAVLWLQKLEVLEQQLVLVPEYRERAKKIVNDMASIAQRVAKAKKRASALSGETFPEWEDEQRGTSGGGEEAN
jgi:Mg2+ and Co2+ transporter CorA